MLLQVTVVDTHLQLVGQAISGCGSTGVAVMVTSSGTVLLRVTVVDTQLQLVGQAISVVDSTGVAVMVTSSGIGFL